MYGAWLVLWVAIDRPWPELLGAGIYSEKYPSCHLNRQRPVPLREVTSAVSYAEAKKVLVAYTLTPGHEWLRTLLDKGSPGWDQPDPIGKVLVAQTIP